MFYGSVCAYIVRSSVFSLSLCSSYFMGSLWIDCAALQEREIASHSWSVTLSYTPFLLRTLYFPPPLLTTISLLLRGMATAGQTFRQGYA